MKNKAKGLFDEQFRLNKLTNQNDPLVKLRQHVDFELFRKPLEDHFNAGKDRNQGGRPSFDYLLMFKILILQRYYNLSDDSIEYAVLDRLSFMRFLGLTISDNVPDAKTVWNFRNELTKANLVEKLFILLDKTLDKRGVILHKGKMVDASIVEVPIQRNSRDENNELKNGSIPEEWKENSAKLSQKDTDAKWSIQKGKSYYGYKNHIKADVKTKLITTYEVTPANVLEGDVLPFLISKKDRGQKLYGDKAYYQKDNEELLASEGIISRIHVKAYRYQKLTKKQESDNKIKSKTRARVEHIFAFMSNTMKRMQLQCRSLKRIETSIGLMNITYNLFRLTQLNVSLKR
ncbi:IS5 family transposase [Pseudochryseolinea flava]|uniref:IS5 family transposase n=1 Tax=Pseudochryseolinea flava TaxID=2059302 RepID=A0A364XT71_9BACT|nr:IS5 family transposase [Pseudochryseolinea flava]RAV97560.1 IS5 family transposase [Pseudochryseolinea flava]